jgi:hypothetical protein
MIMPGLPKRFYSPTHRGNEWQPFWDGLWLRAQEAIAEATELVIIGYSLPEADKRARSLLLGATNKSLPLTICCGTTTRNLEHEFRNYGFTAIRQIADPTFSGFLTATA